KLVAVPHGRVQNTGRESDRIDNQHITLPPTYGMTRPTGLDVGRMVRHIHVDRPLQSELAILNNDCVLALCDAVDGTIESPIEDDARRLAAKARIIVPRKFRSRLLSKLRQFGPTVEPRPCGLATTPACATGAGRAFAGLVLTQLAERHQSAANAAW